MPRKYRTKKQAEKAAQQQRTAWKKENTTVVAVRFNNDKDAEVIAKLASVENKGDYIRQLILKDIMEGK